MTSFYCFAEFAASLIETLMCCFFCRIFIECNYFEKHKAFFLSVVGSTIAVSLNNIELFSNFNAVFAVVILGAIQILIYRKQVGYIIVLVMIYIVVVSAIDFFVARVISILISVDVQYLLTEESIVRIGCIIFSKTVLILTVGIILKIHKTRRELSKKYLAIMFLIAFFMLTTNFILIEINLDTEKSVIELLSVMYFVLSTLLVFFVLYFLLMITDNYEQKQTVALLELQNEMIVKSQSDAEHIFGFWKKSIHDYKNNIIALKQLVEEENIDELKKYLDKECKLMNQKLFCIKTGNSVVDAIVNTKQSLAEDKGITYVVNATMNNKCYISNIDLASILGNLIDNAIEAVDKEENSYIEVLIREEEKILIIKVKNSFQDIFREKNFSMKNNRKFHGIGIKSVKSIVKKYNGEFEIKQENNEVTAIVILLNCKIRM